MSLRELCQSKLLTAPGVYDGMSAKLTQLAGFDAVYASGGAIARSTGRPDIGLLSLTEVVARMSDIVQATTLPVIADADTGFGNELNTMRTVNEFERAGVAAIHLEDQTFPKRCGHLRGKTLISADDMALKIKAAVSARRNPDFMLIARTDAIAVEGFEKALERAAHYANAGADMLFVEAPETVEQIEQIAKVITAPKLINMFYGGKTPLVPAKDLEAMGYRIQIIPSDLQRAAISAMKKTLATIKQDGNSEKLAPELASFNDREAIIETERYFQQVDKL